MAAGRAKARFSSRAAPVSQPLPLWILYPLFFVAVYLAHFRLLRLPWFWDEAGYYIPAALDFFRTGSLIPHSTLTNAHPPLPSVLLAGWWRLTGYHIAATRTFLCMVAAAALLGVFRLARLMLGLPGAVAVTALTAVYPVWFAQSTMAHADLFAAVWTLWGISFVLERYTPTVDRAHAVAVGALFALAALSKETAIVTPVALGLWEVARLAMERGRAGHGGDVRPAASWAWVAAFWFPVLPLLGWYAYHRHVTGYMFGNPEYLRYNASANFAPVRILLSLWHRVTHLTVHMNLWVPVVCALALLPGGGRRRIALPRPALLALAVVLVANALAFSVLGGALLTRYLLPMYPLVLLLCVAVWLARWRGWPWLAGLSAAAFVAALFINPPYSFAPEDNLTYRDFVVLHQQAIAVINRRFPAATVLTAWPATAELQHPDLGYTTHEVAVDAIENFSAASLQRAAADPGGYDTALIFSTRWLPPANHFSLTHLSERNDTRFYDFHRDLSPAQAAALLHGDIVWQGARNGEWAAVLHFPRIVEARAADVESVRATGTKGSGLRLRWK